MKQLAGLIFDCARRRGYKNLLSVFKAGVAFISDASVQ
jgi:hypothetical protein